MRFDSINTVIPNRYLFKWLEVLCRLAWSILTSRHVVKHAVGFFPWLFNASDSNPKLRLVMVLYRSFDGKVGLTTRLRLICMAREAELVS